MGDEQISWGEAEWSRIRQVVHDEALRSRVAASFLPLYGPLPGAAEAVPVNRLLNNSGHQSTLEVDDYTTQRLVSVSVNVLIKNHMLSDPDLTVATDLFRRAANIVARAEDAIVFNGITDGKINGDSSIADYCRIGGAASYQGLASLARSEDSPQDVKKKKKKSSPIHVEKKTAPEDKGPAIFDAIVDAILAAEVNGYHRPFALVLGHDLFRDLHRPLPKSMVLPRDAVPPFIEGPLLRSSELDSDTGVLVSLQGNPVEIVVPADISVRYLQANLDGGHVFRVSQRFLLRIKDEGAVIRIERKE